MKKFILIFIVPLLFLGCNKDDDQRPSGSIAGFIHATDEFGAQDDDFSGVEVSLRDRETIMTTISDISGKYEFKNIKQGTYNLIFKKTGYGTLKLFSVQHIGGSNPTYVDTKRFAKCSKTEVLDFHVSQDSGRVAGKIDPIEGSIFSRRSAVIFIGRDKYVSDTSYLDQMGLRIKEDRTFDRLIDVHIKEKFNIGDTIFLKAYGTSIGASAYFNPETNKLINPSYNQNPTETKYFVYKGY